MTNQDPVVKWRVVATEFHAVQWCLDRGELGPDFGPSDLKRLRKQPHSNAVRAVFSFLLHIYNSANRFDLAEIQRWDEKHLAAFARWVTGASTGEPCKYF